MGKYLKTEKNKSQKNYCKNTTGRRGWWIIKGMKSEDITFREACDYDTC
jgi:hypothetical protein